MISVGDNCGKKKNKKKRKTPHQKKKTNCNEK